MCFAVLAALMLSYSDQAELDSQVRIQSIKLENASKSASLSVQGKTGQTNIVLYADELTSNSWKVLTNLVPTQSPYTVVDLNAPTPLKRFYEVQVMVTAPQLVANMVWIEPGTFVMGSPTSEAGRYDDENQHTVSISQGFWMDKYELTQVQYQAVMGNNPSWFAGDLNRPVEQVSWYDATNYCGKLTAQERVTGRLPAGYVYRLPTEAEWEYACRAGTTTATAFGNNLSSTQANFNGEHPYNEGAEGLYLHKTTKVGSYALNGWGLYDMHGNVDEWCWDRYGSYPALSVTDPKGPSSGWYRVIRGGSWGNYGGSCRSAFRGGYSPDSRHDNVGFRVVLAPEM
jgi:formylglycine-generating enzyme required for sulfatase activity